MNPLKFLALLLLVIAGLLSLSAAGAMVYGRERLWQDVFGPPDLGPYDFSKPTRTGKPNDALACPPGTALCEAVEAERETPVFAVAPEKLLDEIRRTVKALPGTVIVEDSPELGNLRAIVRTPYFHFPDTLSVKVEGDGEGFSKFWLYSRSQIGHTDLGGNDRRIRRLMRQLRQKLEVAKVDK